MGEKKMCGGKELILAQVIRGARWSDFYVVDLEAEKLVRTPVATLFNEAGLGGAVRLGSVIYNVGGETEEEDSETEEEESVKKDSYRDCLVHGDHHVHLGASCLKLSKSHLFSLLKEDDDDPSKLGSGSRSIRWKGSPGMHYERKFLSCASLGGKIYALGGSAPASCIGEVFMPERGDWNPLAPPPPDLRVARFCVSSPVVPDEINGRILVHFKTARALYAYYPATEKWDCLADNFYRWLPATALLDGVLYSHIKNKATRDCLVAYDLSTKSWLKVVYSSPFPAVVCMSKFVNMLHLGNDMLCLANFCPFYEEDKEVRSLYTNLQFIKFRVERTTPAEVHVAPVSMNCFPLEKYLTVARFIAL